MRYMKFNTFCGRLPLQNENNLIHSSSLGSGRRVQFQELLDAFVNRVKIHGNVNPVGRRVGEGAPVWQISRWAQLQRKEPEDTEASRGLVSCGSTTVHALEGHPELNPELECSKLGIHGK